MFTQAYLDTALSLLKNYNGTEPFHLYLKRYYGVFKKFGARDRKHITQLCYGWFRAGRALQHVDQRQAFIYALFLCSDGENRLLENLDAGLNNEAAHPLAHKIKIVSEQVGFDAAQLFPFQTFLSPAIDATIFSQSILIQPDMFLRLRPGHEAFVKAILHREAISFTEVSAQCLALSNNTKVEGILELDKAAVVQDLNSQKVLDLLKEHGPLKKLQVWDCCAASGGKSLLLLDAFPGVELTVSDVRDSILHNLRRRFQQAGVRRYQSFVINAATGAPPHPKKFDLIMCDAPCSGSGTWGRTPEQLHYFTADRIETYAQLQKNILQNVCAYLKPGGLLLYSTCSVFENENEGVVDFITGKNNMGFLKSAYYKGYTQKADTLFAALFKAL